MSVRSLHRQRGFVRAGGGGGGGGGDEPWPVILTVGWMRFGARLVARYKATVSSKDGQLYQVYWIVPREVWRSRPWRLMRTSEALEELIRRAECGDAPLLVQRRNGAGTRGARP